MNDAFDTLLNAIRQCEIIDLSTDISHHATGPFQTRMEVLEPEPGAKFFIDHVLPILMPEAVGHMCAESFPDCIFLRHELVTASVHAGSHIDAPGHYGLKGNPDGAGFINAVPPETFIGPGVLFDAARSAGPEVGRSEIEAIAQANGITEVANKIVLIRTGGDKAISAQAVEALIDEGVKVIGTDSPSFDGPFRRMIESYVASGDSSVLWPCHILGRRRPYYQLERLCNLERLPASGFLVWAPPVLIDGATAAWIRALALVPQKEGE